MRIVAGNWRGRRIEAPAGRTTRPTSDRVREAIFNLLVHRPDVTLADARVADLFAGSGAMGLEALSRGAGHVTFVEQARPAVAALRRNIAALGAADRCNIVTGDATRLPRSSYPCNLIFIDPPYGKGLAAKALASAASSGWLAPESLVVIEASKGEEVAASADWPCVLNRNYGDTAIHILQFNRQIPGRS